MFSSRRALATLAVTGGVAGVAPPASALPASTRPLILERSRLRVGDMIVGPGGVVVRISSIEPGRRCNYRDPVTGTDLPLGTKVGARKIRVIVLARAAPEEAVLPPVSPAPDLIDGGAP